MPSCDFSSRSSARKLDCVRAVKRSGGLVGDYDFRLAGKSLREDYPLELPAAELMRIRSVNPVDWKQSDPRQPTPRFDATLRPSPISCARAKPPRSGRRARITGLSAMPGSCDTSEIFAPRTVASERSSRPSNSLPRNIIEPDTPACSLASSPSTAKERVVFPQPDSPISPTISAASMSKLTSSTAV